MVKIRCIRDSDDRMSISRVYEESWKYAYRGIIPQDYLNSIPRGQWAEAIDSKGRNTQVALEKDRIVGVASYGTSRFPGLEEYGEIYSVYLLPEYIGTGIGKALCSSVIKALSDLGYKNLFLWVLEENKQARCFYEHMGFTCDHVYLTVKIGGKDLREVRYVLRAEPTPICKP